MIQRFLLLWLILLSSISFGWESIRNAVGVPLGDPFLGTSPDQLGYLIALTMFAIGLMLPSDEVRQVLQRWPAVLAGTSIQYICMPILAYLVARVLGFRDEYFVGMIMVGCVPGAMASNVLTLNAGGNTSYSVSLTTLATILSPLAVPFCLQLALSTSDTVQIDALAVSRTLLLTVVGPVVSGHLLSRVLGRLLSQRCPAWEASVRKWGGVIANLAILWIIAVVVGRNREELMRFRWDLLGGLLLINLGGYAVGFTGGGALRLPERMRRALTLEIGMQNAGLGATLATQLFPDQAQIAIAPAMYTFGCMLSGAVLARWWSGRPVAESGSK